MVSASPGPAGSTYDQAPLLAPLSYTAATASDTLPRHPDDARVLHVAWWRINVPAGPRGRRLYLDPSHSTGTDGNSRVDAYLYQADGLYDTAPPFGPTVLLSSFSFGATFTLAPGRTYMVGLGTRVFDSNLPAPAVTYRLLVSDYGAEVSVQLPDVTAVWGYGSYANGVGTGSTIPPTDARYDLGHTTVSVTGPSFVGEVQAFGTYLDNDPGSFTHGQHNDVSPSMALAYGVAADYAPAMTLNPPSAQHSWDIGPEDPDGGRGEPVMPQVSVVSASDLPVWIGYAASASPEVFDFAGSYDYVIRAQSVTARLSAFADAVGPTARSTVYAAELAAHPGANVTTLGKATVVGVQFQPDFLHGTGNPEATVPVDWVDWSDQWRTPFVSNHRADDPDQSVPLRWGPTQSAQQWVLVDGQWVLSDVPDPDPYGQDRNGTTWLGAPAGSGMTDRAALPAGWTDVPDVAAVLAYEATGPNRQGLCVAALPAPLHRGQSPEGYGLAPLQDGPFQSSITAYDPVLVYRTTIRPAPLLFVEAPVVPALQAITDTWLRAMQRTDGLDLGGPPRAVQRGTTTDSVRAGTAVT